jgi:hypothetical protein
VINPESAGKDRTRLSKSVVLALSELMRQTEPNDVSKDLAAYIALALLEIHSTVDSSVTAWEKRGYWVKADRFRMDWEWSASLGNKMKNAVLQEDWANIAMISVQVAQRLMSIQVPVRHRLGTPWVGAWQHLVKGE